MSRLGQQPSAGPDRRTIGQGRERVPEIARFDGISIYIRFEDHRPPHFHATYAEHEVSIAISNLEILRGKLPRTQLRKVMAWARNHQAELRTVWRASRPG